MQKPQYHIFICSSFRANGEPKGVCFKKGADLVQYIQTEVSDAASTPSSPRPVA